jgi:cellulose biosynthesis protein BcsQ
MLLDDPKGGTVYSWIYCRLRQKTPCRANLSRILAAWRKWGARSLRPWQVSNAETLSREGNYDFIVVDTLPRLSSRVLVEAVKEADRLILPLKPSMVDIRATVPAVQMVQENIRSGARAFVLWNMVKLGTKISRELDGLEAMLGLPVLKVAVPERIGFTYASLQGYDRDG